MVLQTKVEDSPEDFECERKFSVDTIESLLQMDILTTIDSPETTGTSYDDETKLPLPVSDLESEGNKSYACTAESIVDKLIMEVVAATSA